jgi:hypothetical protein
MIAYGDTATIAWMLEPPTTSSFSDALLAQIDRERERVSRLIDEQTGRTFGTVGVSQTRTIRSNGTAFGEMLVLPAPARSISAITVNVTDEAGIISGGTVLQSSQWTTGLTDGDGNITAIQVGWFGNWLYPFGVPGTITVTGIWADQDGDDMVPLDIDETCNFIVMREIQKKRASLAGFVGQDGTVTPISNPWNDPTVKQTLRKYELVTHRLVL